MNTQPALLVVKVGTSTLTDGQTGRLRLGVMADLAQTLCLICETGWRVVLVSSGAIGVGAQRLGLKARPTDLATKQAAAAVGQGLLMSWYEQFFRANSRTIAQVLLTRGDLAQRNRYLNAQRTLQALLDLGVVPIINENDTVAVNELTFGDNDTLSALVANLLSARLLVLLTDVAGFYSANPRLDPEARLIEEVDMVSPALRQLAGGRGSNWGTGGMSTKLEAAFIATHSGIPTVITDGSQPRALLDLIQGKSVGTRFKAQPQGTSSRKRWIAHGLVPRGKLFLDPGAIRAITQHHKSLLPAGITALEGEFQDGDLVCLCDQGGREWGRGLVNYTSLDLQRILGKQTREIPLLLDEPEPPTTVVHRDNLIVLAIEPTE
ncbi:glutamate 5-kinase [Anthocerotibacter panamensis]|uniref:glutamate 5-kinase n=1 Tax=Anthocerotibacter panamensis TaxID=2857077 RepID=UPI001C4036E3|nr:glutamate 5-kinase [Anthocerotibacter panamensis]